MPIFVKSKKNFNLKNIDLYLSDLSSQKAVPNLFVYDIIDKGIALTKILQNVNNNNNNTSVTNTSTIFFCLYYYIIIFS